MILPERSRVHKEMSCWSPSLHVMVLLVLYLYMTGICTCAEEPLVSCIPFITRCPENAYCSGWKFRCFCSEGYVNEDMTCMAKTTTAVMTSTDRTEPPTGPTGNAGDVCATVSCTPNSHCEAGVCVCKEGFTYVEAEQQCSEITAGTDNDISTSSSTVVNTIATPSISTDQTATATLTPTHSAVTTQNMETQTGIMILTQGSSPSTIPATVVVSTCMCTCTDNNVEKVATIEELTQQLRSKLEVNTTSLSSYRRKRTCATDKRPSAQSLGLLGAVMLACPFVFLLVLDILTLLKFINERLNI